MRARAVVNAEAGSRFVALSGTDFSTDGLNVRTYIGTDNGSRSTRVTSNRADQSSIGFLARGACLLENIGAVVKRVKEISRLNRKRIRICSQAIVTGLIKIIKTNL